jgi:hypothetical protein
MRYFCNDRDGKQQAKFRGQLTIFHFLNGRGWAPSAVRRTQINSPRWSSAFFRPSLSSNEYNIKGIIRRFWGLSKVLLEEDSMMIGRNIIALLHPPPMIKKIAIRRKSASQL